MDKFAACCLYAGMYATPFFLLVILSGCVIPSIIVYIAAGVGFIVGGYKLYRSGKYDEPFDAGIFNDLSAENPPISQNENAQVTCPHCGSTQIQLVPRKSTFLMGIMTNKVDRTCLNCQRTF